MGMTYSKEEDYSREGEVLVLKLNIRNKAMIRQYTLEDRDPSDDFCTDRSRGTCSKEVKRVAGLRGLEAGSSIYIL